jgi:two-component system chemotaxis response regulator CheB
MAQPGTDEPDVVALVASAGGLQAISAVLKHLPGDLPAAIVVALHLGHGSRLVEILRRRVPMPVDWAQEGERVVPGEVTVCPPGHQLALDPDATCRLKLSDHSPRSLDHLLRSVASGFGPRACAVVLSGTGRDAAAGARAVHDAGGTVLVEDEASAAHAGMPHAAIDAGAADQVLAIEDIGPAIAGRFSSAAS